LYLVLVLADLLVDHVAVAGVAAAAAEESFF